MSWFENLSQIHDALSTNTSLNSMLEYLCTSYFTFLMIVISSNAHLNQNLDYFI